MDENALREAGRGEIWSEKRKHDPEIARRDECILIMLENDLGERRRVEIR
jgi:hypothetical protein